MAWVKSDKWPDMNIPVLLNLVTDNSVPAYELGWFNGIIYVNSDNKTVKVSEWHKLPNPPIKDMKIVTKTK